MPMQAFSQFTNNIQLNTLKLAFFKAKLQKSQQILELINNYIKTLEGGRATKPTPPPSLNTEQH